MRFSTQLHRLSGQCHFGNIFLYKDLSKLNILLLWQVTRAKFHYISWQLGAADRSRNENTDEFIFKPKTFFLFYFFLSKELSRSPRLSNGSAPPLWSTLRKEHAAAGAAFSLHWKFSYFIMLFCHFWLIVSLSHWFVFSFSFPHVLFFLHLVAVNLSILVFKSLFPCFCHFILCSSCALFFCLMSLVCLLFSTMFWTRLNLGFLPWPILDFIAFFSIILGLAPCWLKMCVFVFWFIKSWNLTPLCP